MPLKELEVKYAGKRQKPYKFSDGGGLHLLVQPNGSKLWRLKYRFGGKEKLLSFGKYPDVSLAVARQRREKARALLAEGSDPASVAQVEDGDAFTRSFEAIARQWHANREEGLNPAHAQRVLSRMERDVFPAIGACEINKITTPQVLAMIRKVETRGALDISRRLKQGVSQVFRFAIANGWAEQDPTVHLLGALKPKPRVQHMARVPLKNLPELVQAIANYDGEEMPRCLEITRDALMFTLLTWARTGETRFASWDEFENLDGPEPLWRIPVDRMKMGREKKKLDGLDIFTCGMALEVNDQIVSVGAGAACLGHSLNAAAWLARVMVANGTPLRTGDILLIGALGPMVALSRGDRVKASIGGLGTASFSYGKGA